MDKKQQQKPPNFVARLTNEDQRKLNMILEELQSQGIKKTKTSVLRDAIDNLYIKVCVYGQRNLFEENKNQETNQI